MSGVNVGTAYLEIVPSAKGFVGKLQSDLGGGMSKAGDQAGERFGSGMKGRLGGMAKGIVAPLAAVTAAIGVKDFLGGAISEARESQKVGALTTQVIKSTGGAAKVTADQVGNLATAISNKTGIDDEAIQSGANMLLTFKNIKNEAGKGNDIFNQTTSILTDMSSVMGTEPKQAAIQLGKALNDPIKGISALSRVGVTFTDQQKKTIKSLVDGGKTAQAQKVILKELGSEFGGAAAAQATAGEKAATSWANFKEAIGTAILPILDKLLGSLSTVTSWMTTNLPGGISKVSNLLKPLGSVIGQVWGILAQGDFKHGVLSEDSPVVNFFFNLRDAIINQVIPAARQFGQFVMANVVPAMQRIGGFVTGTVIPAFSRLSQIFVANVLPVIRQVSNFVLTSLVPTLQEIGGIIFNTIVPAVAQFVRGFIADALPAIQKIAGFISGTLVPNVLSLYRTILENVIPIVKELANQFVTNILPALQSLWHTITTKVVPVLIKVANVVVPVIAWLGKLVAKILGFVIPILLRLIGPTLGALIRIISTVIGWIAKFVGALISIGTTIVKFLAPKIKWLYNTIFKPYFGFIGSVVSKAWTGVIKPAFSALSSGIGKVGDAFRAAKDLIGRVWPGVVGKVKGPIETVIKWVGDHFVNPINSLLSKVGIGFRIPWPNIASGGPIGPVGHGGGRVAPVRAYASGGVLPGYSPGTDNMHFVGPHGALSLSGGEAVMRPEWTRAIGVQGVNAMNAAARTGGIGAVRKMLAGHQAFSIGGVIGGIGSGIKDVVGKGVSLAKDAISFITNPGKIIERMLGGITGSLWGKVAKGALGKAISGIVSKVSGFGGGGGGLPLGAKGSGAPGSGWQWMWNLISSHFPGVSLTSAFRPGARVAGSGQQSMHALGRAIDIGGPVPKLLEVARWIASNYGSKSADLLYTPAFGNMGIYRGKWYRQPSITTAEHGKHIHWGYKKGGIIPEFDRGGTLAPGINVVRNNLGRPEPLVRADQGGQPIHIEINGVPMDNANAVAKELLFSMNRNGIGKWASV